MITPVVSVLVALLSDEIKGDHLFYLVLRLIVVLLIVGLIVKKVNWNKKGLIEIEGDKNKTVKEKRKEKVELGKRVSIYNRGIKILVLVV